MRDSVRPTAHSRIRAARSEGRGARMGRPSRRVPSIAEETRDPLPEARRGDRGDRDPARHDRGHRPGRPGPGLGCPDWPGCFDGQFLPSLSDDYQAWIEWIHRTVAVIIGFEVIGLAILALVDLRDARSLVGATVVAVAARRLPGVARHARRFGWATPASRSRPISPSAMALVGLLVWILARSLYPGPARRAAGASGSRWSPRSAPGRCSRCCCSGRT